ncbi:hypothetical protein BO78DRAFT_415557 [Aspergillus sclerotiicarbonarius CBS 121057]|uniref:Uncharacterized protein n=1 Tax=Aspergillus sclerotiicarbonarius (strain CBS 121057 / IBT 28362) TaxID=1448318 RepID=A0A319EH19_ASPSB|nr:hypothetical protein BO78DRAFT_415557 [Aspergillus sclerotiicarbonarius CBS 121057]
MSTGDSFVQTMLNSSGSNAFNHFNEWRQILIYAGVALYLAYTVMYFSPFAGIPGPKLAALTHLDESYYEIVHGGQYFKRVAELHSIYGWIFPQQNQ